MDIPHINFVDYKSILIINPVGKMRQIFVPFRVQVIYDTTLFKQNTWVIVEEVLPHNHYKLIYRIGEEWWQYNLFRISIVF